MSTWGTLKAEIQLRLNRPDFETGGSLESYLLIWANRIVKGIVSDIDIRYLFKTASTAITTANYIFTLPTDYFKFSNFYTKVRVSDTYISVVTLDVLNSYDPDHDITSSGGYPTVVSIDNGNIYVYPKVSCTLVIENYIRENTDMAAVGDSPDLPYTGLLDDVIINGVCFYGYKWLNERGNVEKLGLMEDAWNDYLKAKEIYRVHLERNDLRQKIEMEYF